MNVRVVENEKDWEEFVCSNSHTPFSQSFYWRKMQEAIGKKIWTLGIYDGKKLKSSALIVKEETRLGPYLNCPDGPVGQINNDSTKHFVDYLKGLAKEEDCVFFRLDPRVEDNEQNRAIFKSLGFSTSSGLFQVLFGWVLDLTKSEEDLLAKMRKTTRYEIRQGAKENLKIWSSTSVKDLVTFHELLKETAGRKGFKAFPKNYLETQLELFSKKDQAKLFFAKKGSKIRAGAFVMFYGDTATYLHGASISDREKTSASYILQWEIIKEAKKRGFKLYDFWGVIDNEDKSHPWYGISLFKKGFGGDILPYIKSQDFPLSFKYTFVRLLEQVRKLTQ